MRSGFLSFFFLIPLGFIAASYNSKTAWTAALVLILLDGVISLCFIVFSAGETGQLWFELLYTSLTSLCFVWIMVKGKKSVAFFRVRTAHKFIISAVVVSCIFLLVLHSEQRDGDFSRFVRTQAEMLSSLYISAAGTDAVRLSVAERIITPEKILEIMLLVVTHGGAVASCLVLFFISRQAALGLARIIRRVPLQPGITGFHANTQAVWVLSFSLLGIMLSHFFHFQPLALVSWNILTICGFIYLAQGAGIVLFFLGRRSVSPFFRLLLNVLVVIVFFSPGINAFALGAVVLLGIAENWLPLRAPKTEGSDSTPNS
jgi:hypothetical protein